MPSQRLHATSLRMQEDVKKKLQAQLEEAQAKRDLDVVPIWAGSGVGMIEGIEPAKGLVQAIAGEAVVTIQQLARAAA